MSEVLLVIAVLIIFFLFYKNSSLRAEIESRARQQYEAWREKELQTIREQYQEITQKEAILQLQRWQQESEDGIRKDAIEKSRAVILGKVSEHLVPFFPGFQHNPKDARFIGTPVDFVVFDGLDDGEVRGITFMEVKTGSSSLNTRERQVRNVVTNGASSPLMKSRTYRNGRKQENPLSTQFPGIFAVSKNCPLVLYPPTNRCYREILLSRGCSRGIPVPSHQAIALL